MHYLKLITRSLLFLTVLVFYILDKTSVLTGFVPLPIAVWVFFVVEMIFRFFPSRVESMGCQKQFKRNYEPTDGAQAPENQSWKSTALVAAVWLLLNGAIGLLYFLKLLDVGLLILIALAFSVCDIICILFFCPFQTWFMKNKCCGSCRIYNWDFIMMFTPLIFFRHPLAHVLVGLALLLLIRWELGAYLSPERYYEDTNTMLSCANCTEHLCHHKKQLKGFHKWLISKGYELIRK